MYLSVNLLIKTFHVAQCKRVAIPHLKPIDVQLAVNCEERMDTC